MSQAISIERLKEIAETEFEDVDELLKVVRELAIGLVQVMETKAPSAEMKPAKNFGRMPGKPIPKGIACTTCSRCGEGIAMFISKKNDKAYKCDTELGDYQNKRQLLSAPNWFHKCEPTGMR